MAYITLNKKNFFTNLDIIANKTKSKDKIALVLKDNAYGHGLLEISKMAQEYGIKKAVVKDYDEAMKIYEYFESILVLADFPSKLDTKISYTINSIESIHKFPKGTRVALKIDTGMHRNGICINEIELAKQKIQESQLVLEAVFTHHRSADTLSSEWFWQNEQFSKVKKMFSDVEFHSSNSASLFRCDNFSEDIARIGIAAYGCLEIDSAFENPNLLPVLSVYAEKISSRKVKKAEGIGYGATFYAKEDLVVSNYNFGYGDGFLRASSNRYLTPESISLVGRISMDNASFISDSQNILIFNDAREMAKSAQTISYEVLTSLKKRLKRSIV